MSEASGLLTVTDPNNKDAEFYCCVNNGMDSECVLQSCTADQVCPAPNGAVDGITNGTCIQEGWSSIIKTDGQQHMMPLFTRTDGMSEAR